MLTDEEKRERNRARVKRWRLANPEKSREQQRKARVRNAEHVRAIWREWYAKNRLRLTAKLRERYAKDPQFRKAVRARIKKHRKLHPDWYLAEKRKYAETHPHIVRAQAARTYKKAREVLSDGYVKKLLSNAHNTPRHVWPSSLIALKRVEMQLKRSIK